MGTATAEEVILAQTNFYVSHELRKVVHKLIAGYDKANRGHSDAHINMPSVSPIIS